MGQVSVNLHALDQPGAAPAPVPAPGQPAAPVKHPKTHGDHKAPPSAQKPSTEASSTAAATAPAKPAAPAATLPTAPPPMVSLAPGRPPVPAPTPPPPVVPISAAAGTTTHPITGGLRVEFAADHADLSPDTDAAIKSFAAGSGTNPQATYNVMAYAAGSPEDPSTARRMSLSRALAIRAALMDAGVASAKIYVRALGAPANVPGAEDPADRADITILGANAPAAPPTAATANSSQAKPK